MTVAATCPKCSADLLWPNACSECGIVLSEPAEATHFSRLQLPELFELDAADLEKTYTRLSRLVHPDFFSAAGEQQRALAERHSTVLNQAFQVLRDPWERAQYLLHLKLQGDVVDAKAVDQALLMEVLDVQEKLDHWAVKDLTAEDQTQIQEVITHYAQRLQGLLRKVAAAFEAWQRQVSAQTVKALLNEKKYYHNIIDAARNIEQPARK